MGGQRFNLLPVVIASGAVVLALDALTPLGFTAFNLYVGVVLLASWLPWQHAALWTAAGCTLLIPLGALLSPFSNADFEVILINRAIAAGCVWLVALLIIRRKKAEVGEQLAREARAYAESVVETVREPLVILDADLRVHRANRSFYEKFRTTPGAIEHRLFFELGNGQWDIPKLREILHAIIPQHTEFNDFEAEYEIEGIGRRTMILNGRKLFRPGNNTSQILVAIEDITERKRAAEGIARLASIVASSHDAIISKTLDGIVTSWNQGAEQLFGYTAGEMIGHPIIILLPPDRIEEEAHIIASLRQGKILDHFETVRRSKDGRLIDVSLTISPIRDERGTIIGISKIARDITQRKRAEEEIRRKGEQLEAANKELEAFSYSVSHDLRAPLRHINGFAELLGKHAAAALDDKGRRFLQTISDSAKQMGALVDDLLSFSRVGRTEMRSTPVRLDQLVKDVLDEIQPEVQNRHIAWTISPLPEVHGDPPLLRQVLINLIGNAVKYTRPREQAAIEVGCLNGSQTEHVVFVRDNGAGFDMQYAHKLFGVFQRLHTAGEFEGTGIGLANVQRIIHRHGGRVWAEGTVNGGATFYVAFPARKEASHDG